MLYAGLKSAGTVQDVPDVRMYVFIFDGKEEQTYPVEAPCNIELEPA
jgi:hypothetical protein